MNVNERLLHLRKSLKMSQSAFGESVGVSRDVINNLERVVNPTDPKPQFINLVCQVHHVNRTWLETGEGEMFADMSRTEKLAKFVAQALADKPESFRHWLVGVLIDLDDDGWQLLEDAAKLFAGYGEQKKKEDE